MRESDLHQHIYARSVGLNPSGGYESIVGPGDDCAVLKSASGEILLITTDQLVEGRHFESGTPIDLIARKAVARSVSDIAAMGGTPAWALGTGTLPKNYPYADELFDAMSRWATHWGCPLVGGDIATHDEPNHPLTLSVSVGGVMNDGHSPVVRSGAQPGDLVYLTGQVGGSLKSGWHQLFEPRIDAGRSASAIGSGVHAMMDLSDGIGLDSDRIARASGVVVEIDASALPISHHCDGWREAVSQGEDYELIMCVDPDTRPPVTAPLLIGPVGQVRACARGDTPGSIIMDPHGQPHPGQDLGWDH